MRLFSRHPAIVVLGRNPSFGKIEHASHIGPSGNNRERSSAEMRFEDGSRDGSKPSLVEPSAVAVRRGHVDRCKRSAIAHEVKHGLRVIAVGIDKVIETARSKAVFVHTETKERPCVDGNDTRFVGPLLCELAATVYNFVEESRRIRTQAREERLVMRRNQYVNKIELDQSEMADNAPKVAGSNGPLGPGRVKSLCRKGDTACGCQ